MGIPLFNLRVTAAFAVMILLLALLTLFPLPGVIYRVLAIMFMYAAMAEGWNIIGGYAGYVSLASAAFFGLSSYITAFLLKNFYLSPFFTVFLGGFLCVLTALAIGYPTLRLKGDYFVLVTLAVTLAFKEIALVLSEFSGGGKGIYNLHTPGLSAEIEPLVYYIYFLVLMSITMLVAYKIENSKIGLGLMAIREDEEAAVHMGVNVTVLKTLAFILNAFIMALAGGIYSVYLSYINPDIVFSVLLSVTPMLMTILGGKGTWLGPVVGAFIIQGLMYGMSFLILSELNLFVVGSVLALVIMMMPRGIMGFLIKRFRGRLACWNAKK